MRRRLRSLVAAAAGSALIGTLMIPASAASWTDREWIHGTAATLNCAAMDSATTRGAGKLLGGELLGTDLDTLAEVEDVVVVNDGTASSVDTANAAALGDDAYANPLSVQALQSVNAGLGGLLVLPLGAEVGVANQFGQAKDTGYSAGAAGMVSNSGGIDLNPETDPELPRFATLELGEVLNAALGEGTGTGITNLTDVRLGIGAVASRAELDSCTADWQGNIYSALNRQYAIAGLDAELETPLATGLVSTTDATLSDLESTVETLAGPNGAVNEITDLVLGPKGLGPVLGTLLLDRKNTVADLGLAIDLSAVRTLLTKPFSDAGGNIVIDPQRGTVSVDLAALLGPEYQDSAGLNGLAPNTRLLINSSASKALTAALTSTLDVWTAQISSAVTQAVDAIEVQLSITLPVQLLSGLLPVEVGTLSITAGDSATGKGVSLAALRAGQAEVKVTLKRSGVCSGILVGSLCSVVNGVVDGLAGFASNQVLGPLIAGVLDRSLLPLVTGLGTDLQTLVGPLVSVVSTTLQELFGPDSALSLVANAQNQPDPAELAGLNPTWTERGPWPELEGTGQYDVAALRIDVIGPLQLAQLELARSSIGPNVVR
ncbi:choice-of-anchor G family protein [Arthrobacter crystallopoietes]|uniref:choice-of-anchor G family protein n=1 Tax=Crystallibacter crystallopoietes TaxID=37928 RepID=UPI001111199F|nr:choice-of-anchor G family protein [Arthrobacter crystallopoietes]